MSCDGYEHGRRVVLARNLRKYGINKGACGTVQNINRASHTIDVTFYSKGKVNNLDPHIFIASSSAENQSYQNICQLATEIVAAYVGANSVSARQLPELILSVVTTLGGLEGGLARG